MSGPAAGFWLSERMANGVDAARRVNIADHIRATCFLLADGVLPENTGRGYVLRRIIRRALRHGHQLGVSEPFFHKLVPVLAEVMGDAYPELVKGKSHVIKVLAQEEARFAETLDQGMEILEAAIADLDVHAALAFG